MGIIEEKYDQDMWYVLSKLKDLNLRKIQNNTIEYVIELDDPRDMKADKPTPTNECLIVENLKDNQVVEAVAPSEEIKASVGNYILRPSYIFYLKIEDIKFDKIFNKFSKKFKEANGTRKIIIPTCKKAGDLGYLSFYNTDKILIGRNKSQQFRLLSYLMNPEFGIAKSVGTTYEFITKNKKVNDSSLRDSYLKKNTMVRTIENTIKELQKERKLKCADGEIKFKFDKNKTKVFLEYKRRD